MKTLPIIFLLVCFLQLQAQVSDFSHIDFKKADNIATLNKGNHLDNLPELAYHLTANLTTDVERFRAIYKWVSENIANDYGLYLKNKHKRERFKNDSIKFRIWNDNFRKKLFKKLLKQRKTICTGYAYLIKELAELANIECEIVQGYGRVSTTDIENLNLPNHSWNAVKLNNKWYLCDPTWASGIPNPETNQFKFQYNDGFFLAHPKLFAVNHFPVDAKWWLLDGDIPLFENFLASPIIYGKAYEYLEQHSNPKEMHHIIKKNSTLNFGYLLKKTIAIKDVKLLIDSGSSQRKTEPTSISIEDKELLLEHQFKNKGFYDVHLYFSNDLIATYTVKVI